MRDLGGGTVWSGLVANIGGTAKLFLIVLFLRRGIGHTSELQGIHTLNGSWLLLAVVNCTFVWFYPLLLFLFRGF